MIIFPCVGVFYTKIFFESFFCFLLTKLFSANFISFFIFMISSFFYIYNTKMKKWDCKKIIIIRNLNLSKSSFTVFIYFLLQKYYVLFSTFIQCNSKLSLRIFYCKFKKKKKIYLRIEIYTHSVFYLEQLLKKKDKINYIKETLPI